MAAARPGGRPGPGMRRGRERRTSAKIATTRRSVQEAAGQDQDQDRGDRRRAGQPRGEKTPRPFVPQCRPPRDERHPEAREDRDAAWETVDREHDRQGGRGDPEDQRPDRGGAAAAHATRSSGGRPEGVPAYSTCPRATSQRRRTRWTDFGADDLVGGPLEVGRVEHEREATAGRRARRAIRPAPRTPRLPPTRASRRC